MGGLSKNQTKILELLEIKPDMTTKEIAEMVFGKIVEYKSKEYASVHKRPPFPLLVSLYMAQYAKALES